MTKIVQLMTQSSSFEAHGVRFTGPNPQTVDDDVAERLQATGYVRILMQPDDLDGEGDDGSDPDGDQGAEIDPPIDETAAQLKKRLAAEKKAAAAAAKAAADAGSETASDDESGDETETPE